MAVRALGAGRLTEEERKADRKTLRNYDLCALGERAVYLPGGLLPRRRYLLWSEIARIYKRVAVSPATGKAFLTPVLYIVFAYGGGQEEAVRFRYVHDADRMFEDIREHHPEISLMSRKGEEEKAEKERKERELLERPLMPEAEKTVRRLEEAETFLEKRPALSQRLAACAAKKRKADAVRPSDRRIALALFLAGCAAAVYGFFVLRTDGVGPAFPWLLGGIACMFVMLNSRILPAPGWSRKAAEKEWSLALEAVQANLKGFPQFPVPAAYAHPAVLSRMIRIVREGRAVSTEEALAALADDLKRTDSSVALDAKDYGEVTAVKPLFMVMQYRLNL
ncbi:hypothetical protein [Chordicoccus furentiruminis]|uniref:hypothetical protein n=1 Tax=Chordicoccus furentiruminis TaxID=2709410 RepID=UPI0023A8F424|nr:hypothetical protein [Chordicoccus furentiruminis]